MEASEFDEWFEGEMPNSHKKVNKERIETVIYSCAEASWNHQQAKIDDLQARIDEITNHVGINFDEERDDDQHSYWSGYNQAMRELNDILKGNKDEN